MASPQRRPLTSSSSGYVKAFKHFLQRSTGHQSMQAFLVNELPDILARTLNGKSHLSVMGVGSGAGELDLQMFSTLSLKYPHVSTDIEVVEPDSQLIHNYKDSVTQTPGLDHVSFTWHHMSIEEFEQRWREGNTTKKFDLIHMFQVLYYVKDLEATVDFVRSLLDKNGTLLVSLVSGDSDSMNVRQTYGKELCNGGVSMSIHDIKRLLDSSGVSYQTYKIPCRLDITEVVTEGDENGELLLDFLTHELHFSKSASPELRAKVKESVLHLSLESNGRVFFNNDYELLVVNQLN